MWSWRRLTLGVCVGLGIHVFADVVFAALVALRIEGCDASDGNVAAWLLGVTLNFVLWIAALCYILLRCRQDRLSLVVGFMVSVLPQVLFLCAILRYVNTLLPGCPI